MENDFSKVMEVATRNQLKKIMLAFVIVIEKNTYFSLYSLQNSKSCLHGRHMKDGFNYAASLAGVCVPGVQTTKWKIQSLSALYKYSTEIGSSFKCLIAI